MGNLDQYFKRHCIYIENWLVPLSKILLRLLSHMFNENKCFKVITAEASNYRDLKPLQIA